jgi:hypothetical protein
MIPLPSYERIGQTTAISQDPQCRSPNCLNRVVHEYEMRRHAQRGMFHAPARASLITSDLQSPSIRCTLLALAADISRIR